MQNESKRRSAKSKAPNLGRLIQHLKENESCELALFRHVFNRSATPWQVIKAQCLVCRWFDRRTIMECTSVGCPLWGYRPYRTENDLERKS